jgi:hypothetical protein
MVMLTIDPELVSVAVPVTLQLPGRLQVPDVVTMTVLFVGVKLMLSVTGEPFPRQATSVERATLPPPRLSSVKLSSATASPRVITLDGFEATHAALRRMGMNNEFNYRSQRCGPDSKLSLLEQRRRTRSPEGKKPRGSNAWFQALLQRPACSERR